MTGLSATNRRIAKLVPLLGSDQPGEVTAAASALVRVLKAGDMDLNDLAALIAGELERRARPAFSFASVPPRSARKSIAALDRQPGLSAEDRSRLHRYRAWLLGKPTSTRLPASDTEWLNDLWRRAFGGGS